MRRCFRRNNRPLMGGEKSAAVKSLMVTACFRADLYLQISRFHPRRSGEKPVFGQQKTLKPLQFQGFIWWTIQDSNL